MGDAFSLLFQVLVNLLLLNRCIKVANPIAWGGSRMYYARSSIRLPGNGMCFRTNSIELMNLKQIFRVL